MKRFFLYFVGTAMAMMSLSSCSQEDDVQMPASVPSVASDGELVPVTFNVKSAAAIRSRSGRWNPENCRVSLGVYDSNNKLVLQHYVEDDDNALSYGKLPMTVKLAKDTNYKLFFWAEIGNDTFFHCDLEEARIEIDSYEFGISIFEPADAEHAWAYCAYIEVDTHSAIGTMDITLKSPFAEVALAADYGDTFDRQFPDGVISYLGNYNSSQMRFTLPKSWDYLDDTLEWADFGQSLAVYDTEYDNSIYRENMRLMALSPVLCQRKGTTFSPTVHYTDRPVRGQGIWQSLDDGMNIALPSYRFMPNTRVTYVDHIGSNGMVATCNFDIDVDSLYDDETTIEDFPDKSQN